MPAAIAIPAIISGGAAIGSAVINHNAASNATKAETSAGQQALAVEQNQYNQTRSDLAPYRNAGSGSLAKLGGIFGVPMAGGGNGDSTVPPAPGTPGTFQRSVNGPPLSGTYVGQAVPRPQAQTLGQLGGGGDGSMVPVQAPNGNIYSVPVHRVHEAVANGGKVVS